MIKQLETNFEGTGEVKGFKFTQIISGEQAFLYEVTPPDAKPHFEVFMRKNSPLCIDFENRIYSETDFKEIYPRSKDFGVWAWCISNREKAFLKFNSINNN